MLLVATTGNGSMDTYAKHLAAGLSVPCVWTDIYKRQDFGIPFWNMRSVRLAKDEAKFVRQLQRRGTPLHLPNQHLARYGLFLRQPYLVTVHDVIRLIDLNEGEALISHPGPRDRFYLRMDYAGVQRAAAVLTPSAATKADVVRHLRVAPSRVFVTPLGVDHGRFHPGSKPLVDFPYILFVGSEHPRKNLETVLEGLRVLKDRPGMETLRLLKVGDAGGIEGPYRERTEDTIRRLGLEHEVVFTGRVPTEDLPAYYFNAVCLVMTSVYEGFGLPPLEAMACGCPAVVSNAGALAEVASEAALTVDPRDPRALAAAVARLVEDRDLRGEMVRRGLERAAGYTWARTVNETESVYRDLGM